jgi:hypothetical protein
LIGITRNTEIIAITKIKKIKKKLIIIKFFQICT